MIAAQEILRARTEGFDKLDRVPRAANSIDRIMDRTEGKPRVTMEITHVEQPSMDQIRQELLQLYAQHPQLLDNPLMQTTIAAEARQS